jgi:hypothetical protein
MLHTGHGASPDPPQGGHHCGATPACVQRGGGGRCVCVCRPACCDETALPLCGSCPSTPQPCTHTLQHACTCLQHTVNKRHPPPLQAPHHAPDHAASRHAPGPSSHRSVWFVRPLESHSRQSTLPRPPQ